MLKQAYKTFPHFESANNKHSLALAPNYSQISKLQAEDEKQALDFLAERPLHNVVMASWIRDNGIENHSLNRGTFYGYRNNDNGELEGIALIGHSTIIEARTDEAIKAFAWIARQSDAPLHFLIAAGNSVEIFWGYYVEDNRAPRLMCTELMFEMKFPVPVKEFVPDLRKATKEDLMLVAEAHAQVAFEESGVNPLERDKERFLERTLIRIEKGWCWVVVRDGKLLFKVDVVAQTSAVAYLEGIYVKPEMRGRGVGSNCLSQVGRDLLLESKSICLLSNIELQYAHKAYKKAGFKMKGKYQTIFT